MPPARSLLGHYSHLVAAQALVCAVTVTAVVAYPRAMSVSNASSGTGITVSSSGCGEGWNDPRSGAQTLRFDNSGTGPADVQIVDPGTGAVYGELDAMGPGSSRSMRVALGGGTYAVRCLIADQDALVGRAVHISGGPGSGGPGVVPVTRNDLIGPVRAYTAYVTAGLADVTGQVDELQAAVQAGDLDRARGAWLTAYLTYRRLGGAYGTFGDFDRRIDPRADGLPGGTDSPSFTGFHRLEHGLWNAEPAATLAPVAAQLDRDVRALRAAWPDMEMDPGDLGLRAHEVMENSVQLDLTGVADYGSGSGLAAAAAGLTGTRELLSVLRPLLTTRYPALPQVDTWMGRVDDQLAADRRPDGSWPAPTSLPAAQRARLDGTVGGLLERLAPIAVICEPRRTS
jgi:iron uptake system component EfeO